MGLPVTFTKHGRHVVTLMNKQQAAALPFDLRSWCALAIACRHRFWKDGIAEIIACGLANEPAEADELIYAAETREARGY